MCHMALAQFVGEKISVAQFVGEKICVAQLVGESTSADTLSSTVFNKESDGIIRFSVYSIIM